MPDKSYCYATEKHGGVYFDASYDAEFVQLIKERIPQEHRKWHPEMKQWWVSNQYAKQARRFAESIYGNVIEC